MRGLYCEEMHESHSRGQCCANEAKHCFIKNILKIRVIL